MTAPGKRQRRPRQPARARWLRDARGRLYPLASQLHAAFGAVGFEVYRQADEGHLWRRLVDAAGAPRVVPLTICQADFLTEIADAPGCYQLVLVDATGRAVGTPPEMIHLAAQVDDPETRPR